MLRRQYYDRKFHKVFRTFSSSQSATDSNITRRGRQNDQPGSSTKTPPAGQILLEYILVIGVIVLVLFAMNKVIQRSAQGMIKVVADQVGVQANAEQKFVDSGYLSSSISDTSAVTSKTKTEISGVITFDYDDVITTESQAIINLGFTEEDL